MNYSQFMTTQKSKVCISSQLRLEGLHTDSLKSVTVGEFIRQKLESTTNQGTTNIPPLPESWFLNTYQCTTGLKNSPSLTFGILKFKILKNRWPNLIYEGGCKATVTMEASGLLQRFQKDRRH